MPAGVVPACSRHYWQAQQAKRSEPPEEIEHQSTIDAVRTLALGDRASALDRPFATFQGLSLGSALATPGATRQSVY